ncbi:MAG: hypothetical protein OXL40_10120 [Bacteroidota bacterium]|nr:hypothetical protein [Bacteroidota bacterium]
MNDVGHIDGAGIIGTIFVAVLFLGIFGGFGFALLSVGRWLYGYKEDFLDWLANPSKHRDGYNSKGVEL